MTDVRVAPGARAGRLARALVPLRGPARSSVTLLAVAGVLLLAWLAAPGGPPGAVLLLAADAVVVAAGVATWARGGPVTHKALLADADAALYVAKVDGRNVARAAALTPILA